MSYYERKKHNTILFCDCLSQCFYSRQYLLYQDKKLLDNLLIICQILPLYVQYQ